MTCSSCTCKAVIRGRYSAAGARTRFAGAKLTSCQRIRCTRSAMLAAIRWSSSSFCPGDRDALHLLNTRGSEATPFLVLRAPCRYARRLPWRRRSSEAGDRGARHQAIPALGSLSDRPGGAGRGSNPSPRSSTRHAEERVVRRLRRRHRDRAGHLPTPQGYCGDQRRLLPAQR